jgi:hypothetical protein
MFEAVGLVLMAVGLLMGVSTFRAARQATQGIGPNRLRPLSWTYWLGLALIVVGAGLQLVPDHYLPFTGSTRWAEDAVYTDLDR